MSSAYSTIRVLCLVLAVAVARNASVGSAPTDSCPSGAANLICSSVQLPIPFAVENVATVKIGNGRVDLQGPRGFSAPCGSMSAISLVPGSPMQITGSFAPKLICE
jgi:hypothetical protein